MRVSFRAGFESVKVIVPFVVTDMRDALGFMKLEFPDSDDAQAFLTAEPWSCVVTSHLPRLDLPL